MATEKQIKANRKNAKKSTGPRTEEGKARVSMNALKHGLLARDAVMPGEDPEEFDRLFAALETDIEPSDTLEFELVRQIADAQWRMRRLVRIETGLLAAAVDDTRRHEQAHRPERLQSGYDGETLLLGSALLQRTKDLVHLARYDGHLSRRFHRAIQQIADLRDAREKRRQAAAEEDAQAAAYVDPRPGRPLPHERPAANGTPKPANPIGFRPQSRAVGPRASATRKNSETEPIFPNPRRINTLGVPARRTKRTDQLLVPHPEVNTRRTSNPDISSGIETKCMRGPSVRGPRRLAHGDVLEQYGEYGKQA